MILKNYNLLSPFKVLVLAVSITFVAIGCDLSNNNDGGGGNQQPQTVISEVTTSNHGTVLGDDDNGRVLYVFTRDVKGKSNCLDGCLDNWPIMYAQLLDGSTGLTPENFDTTMRANGDIQTTFKGWPLYYFANDDPNTVNGDGVNDMWYVAKANYSLMIADEQLVGADGNNYKSDYTQGEEITTYFTDAEGRTLYAFANDAYETNNYTNEDFSNNETWPILYIDIEELPSAMDQSNFSVIDVHGEQQLTYKGWPLYYFGQDTNPGDTKGVSVPQPGIWPIINSNTSEAPAPTE